MESAKRLTTVKYRNELKWDLRDYFKKCQEQGFKNNISEDSIKLDWCLDSKGQFFLTYMGDQVVSMSGCHPLPEIGANTWRLLFRGATLREYQNIFNVTSKTHMNSIPFLYHIPKQIEWALLQGAEQFVITTNYQNTEIPSMEKSHRVFQLLEKQGLVKCLVEKIDLFYTEQTVWELYIEKYYIKRQEFVNRNS